MATWTSFSNIDYVALVEHKILENKFRWHVAFDEM